MHNEDGYFPYLVLCRKDPVPKLVWNEFELGYLGGKEPVIIETDSSEASLRLAVLVAKLTFDFVINKIEEPAK